MPSTLNFRQALGKPSTARDELIMTDLGMLFVLFLAVFFAMDPFILYIDKRTIFKHLHLMFAVPVFVMAWIGVRISAGRRLFTPVSYICWPLMVLAIWIIAGSLYARFHDNLIETFLTMGLYMLVTLGAARFIADHRNPTILLNTYLGLLLGAIFVGALWQAGILQVWSKFHEVEAFTVPLAVFLFVRAESTQGRIWSVVFMFLLMMLVIKNTSFIVAAITLAYIWWVFVRPRLALQQVLSRLLHYYSLALAGLAVAGVYAGINLLDTSALPDGNTKFRFYTYERTWDGFIHSPIWGKSFTGAGAEMFSLFHVDASTQILPSHSDLLDILGEGGLIGMTVFLYGLWRVARYVRARFVSRSLGTLSPTLEAHFHWLTVSCLSTIPVVAFNPILLQPGKAFLIWMNLGILIGLAIRCAESGQTATDKKSQ